MRRRDLGELVLLAAIWGASFLFMRLGAGEFGAVPLAAVRVAVASLFLLPLLALARQTAGAARALEAGLPRRRPQFGAALRALRLRAAVDHDRPVGDPQRHRAAVRRAGRAGSG